MDYKDLPANETPSSRIREIGPSSLTDTELFAIAIGLSDSETAQRIAGYYHEVRSLGAMEQCPSQAYKKVPRLATGDCKTRYRFRGRC